MADLWIVIDYRGNILEAGGLRLQYNSEHRRPYPEYTCWKSRDAARHVVQRIKDCEPQFSKTRKFKAVKIGKWPEVK